MKQVGHSSATPAVVPVEKNESQEGKKTAVAAGLTNVSNGDSDYISMSPTLNYFGRELLTNKPVPQDRPVEKTYRINYSSEDASKIYYGETSNVAGKITVAQNGDEIVPSQKNLDRIKFIHEKYVDNSNLKGFSEDLLSCAKEWHSASIASTGNGILPAIRTPVQEMLYRNAMQFREKVCDITSWQSAFNEEMTNDLKELMASGDLITKGTGIAAPGTSGDVTKDFKSVCAQADLAFQCHYFEEIEVSKEIPNMRFAPLMEPAEVAVESSSFAMEHTLTAKLQKVKASTDEAALPAVSPENSVEEEAASEVVNTIARPAAALEPSTENGATLESAPESASEPDSTSDETTLESTFELPAEPALESASAPELALESEPALASESAPVAESAPAEAPAAAPAVVKTAPAAAPYAKLMAEYKEFLTTTRAWDATPGSYSGAKNAASNPTVFDGRYDGEACPLEFTEWFVANHAPIAPPQTLVTQLNERLLLNAANCLETMKDIVSDASLTGAQKRAEIAKLTATSAPLTEGVNRLSVLEMPGASPIEKVMTFAARLEFLGKFGCGIADKAIEACLRLLTFVPPAKSWAEGIAALKIRKPAAQPVVKARTFEATLDQLSKEGKKNQGPMLDAYRWASQDAESAVDDAVVTALRKKVLSLVPDAAKKLNEMAAQSGVAGSVMEAMEARKMFRYLLEAAGGETAAGIEIAAAPEALQVKPAALASAPSADEAVVSTPMPEPELTTAPASAPVEHEILDDSAAPSVFQTAPTALEQYIVGLGMSDISTARLLEAAHGLFPVPRQKSEMLAEALALEPKNQAIKDELQATFRYAAREQEILAASKHRGGPEAIVSSADGQHIETLDETVSQLPDWETFYAASTPSRLLGEVAKPLRAKTSRRDERLAKIEKNKPSKRSAAKARTRLTKAQAEELARKKSWWKSTVTKPEGAVALNASVQLEEKPAMPVAVDPVRKTIDTDYTEMEAKFGGEESGSSGYSSLNGTGSIDSPDAIDAIDAEAVAERLEEVAPQEPLASKTSVPTEIEAALAALERMKIETFGADDVGDPGAEVVSSDAARLWVQLNGGKKAGPFETVVLSSRAELETTLAFLKAVNKLPQKVLATLDKLTIQLSMNPMNNTLPMLFEQLASVLETHGVSDASAREIGGGEAVSASQPDTAVKYIRGTGEIVFGEAIASHVQVTPAITELVKQQAHGNRKIAETVLTAFGKLPSPVKAELIGLAEEISRPGLNAQEKSVAEEAILARFAFHLGGGTADESESAAASEAAVQASPNISAARGPKMSDAETLAKINRLADQITGSAEGRSTPVDDETQEYGEIADALLADGESKKLKEFDIELIDLPDHMGDAPDADPLEAYLEGLNLDKIAEYALREEFDRLPAATQKTLRGIARQLHDNPTPALKALLDSFALAIRQRFASDASAPVSGKAPIDASDAGKDLEKTTIAVEASSEWAIDNRKLSFEDDVAEMIRLTDGIVGGIGGKSVEADDEIQEKSKLVVSLPPAEEGAKARKFDAEFVEPPEETDDASDIDPLAGYESVIRQRLASAVAEQEQAPARRASSVAYDLAAEKAFVEEVSQSLGKKEDAAAAAGERKASDGDAVFARVVELADGFLSRAEDKASLPNQGSSSGVENTPAKPVPRVRASLQQAADAKSAAQGAAVVERRASVLPNGGAEAFTELGLPPVPAKRTVIEGTPVPAKRTVIAGGPVPAKSAVNEPPVARERISIKRASKPEQQVEQAPAAAAPIRRPSLQAAMVPAPSPAAVAVQGIKIPAFVKIGSAWRPTKNMALLEVMSHLQAEKDAERKRVVLTVNRDRGTREAEMLLDQQKRLKALRPDFHAPQRGSGKFPGFKVKKHLALDSDSVAEARGIAPGSVDASRNLWEPQNGDR